MAYQPGGGAVVGVLLAGVGDVEDVGAPVSHQRAEPVDRSASSAEGTVGEAPEGEIGHAEDDRRSLGLGLAGAGGLGGVAAGAAALPGGEEDHPHLVAVEDVRADGAAAADGLVVGVGAKDEDAAHSTSGG